MQDVHKELIESFIINAKIDKGRSAKTIKNSLCYLSLFFEWCVNEGIIDANPAKNISRPRVPKRVMKGLSAEEAKNLIEYAKNMPTTYKFYKVRGVAIIAVFLYTGIRFEELRSLKVSDVDISNRVLLVKNGK